MNQVEEYEIKNRSVFSVSPKSEATNIHILYLHGGGYSKSFLSYHWDFIGKLVSTQKCSVTAPDYPLSTHASVTEVFEMLVPLYETLVEQHGASNIILMGDSAGGGMALALTELLVSKNIEQPAQQILLSPWLDLTLSNPLIDAQEKLDFILDRKVMQKLGEDYAGDSDITHFLASPIYGEIKRVAPITLFVGSEDILLADCRKLKTRAESEPMIFNYREFKSMVHNWMFLPIPDAKKAFTMITDQINLQPAELEDPVNAGGNFW